MKKALQFTISFIIFVMLATFLIGGTYMAFQFEKEIAKHTPQR